MQVADLDAVLAKVVGEVLGEPLGQRGDERAVPGLRPLADLGEEVVDLALCGPHLDRRVDEPRRPDDHLDGPLRAPRLVRARRRRDVDHALRPLLPLVEAERPVVERAWQPEAVLDERGLARAVAAQHSAYLRHGHVRLVDEDQRVRGQEVHECERRVARLAAGQVPGIVLDPGAGPGLPHHLHVEHRPLPQALRLQQASVLLEPAHPVIELGLDVAQRQLHLRVWGDVVAGREDLQLLAAAQDLASHAVQLEDAVDLVAEELDPVDLLLVCRNDVDHVAANPKAQAREVVVIALVQHLGELA